MKHWVCIFLLCILFSTCRITTCEDVVCDPCPSTTANDLPLIELDTSANSFKSNEIDTIYVRRLNAQMQLIDSTIWTLHSEYIGDWDWNEIEGRAFDDLDHAKLGATYYQVQVKDRPEKYILADFDIKIFQNRSECCNCRISFVENVTIDGVVFNRSKLPYIIKK
jgi:hypothetical protein